MTRKILAQGAEAIITLKDDEIIKNRIEKSYRIPVLDERIRKSRTKAEAKIIKKLSGILPVPKIIKTDDKQEIIMEFIKGDKLSNSLENLDYKKICRLIGENISKMHDAGIIHGDLTTSNMIYVEKDKNLSENITSNISQNADIINIKSAKQLSKRRLLSKNIKSSESEIVNPEDKVYFIDFGLAFHSSKIEDKAVDLHLLRQALEAKHFTIEKECFKIILDNYRPQKYKEIIERIKVIESRGRYKDKY